VECIAAGKMVFSDRTLLGVTVQVSGKESATMTGLNDAVLSRGEVSRLVRLKTRVNGEPLTEFNADGLIVATPTGSTAIPFPPADGFWRQSQAFVITPICPHVLTNRSIIVDESAVIEIEVTEREYPVFSPSMGESHAYRSGQHGRNQEVTPCLAAGVFAGVSFFSVVRQKLKWSGSNI
jgi:NAD+ kinase